MTGQPVIARFIKLCVDKPLDPETRKSWFRTVRAQAPSGVLATQQTVDAHGQPQAVAMVALERKSGVEYVVPLTRDLIDEEVQRVVDAFAEAEPDLDFDVETSETALDMGKPLPIDLDQAACVSLCTALAKSQHEDWVRERTSTGWRYGASIDIEQKTHPLLRPWDQIPDRFRVPNLDLPQKVVDVLNDEGYAVVRKDELEAILKALRDAV